MFKDIDRVQYKELDFEDFLENYWYKEVPLLIENVFVEKQDLSPDDIKRQFKDKESKQLGWYDSLPQDDLMPELIRNIFKRNDISTRDKFFRVFLQPGGHKTLAHYDGNSIHGLNLQYKGHKDWIIVSPKTPLRNIPFMYIVMSTEIQNISSGIIAYKFQTKPGDLLFLPRYWQHQVNSLDPININFNWVGTPTYPGDSVLAKRENEIIRLRETIPLINKAFFPEPIEHYGGKGKELTKKYIDQTNLVSIGIRLIRELANYLILPRYYRNIKNRADLFVKNNFNV